MHTIPDTILELLETHLEPKEVAKAIQGIGGLLAGIKDRQRERELRFVEERKAEHGACHQKQSSARIF